MSIWEEFKSSRRKKEDDDFTGTAMSTRCYESHPVLKIGKGLLYGGSASHPVVKDADIYVALQSGSTSGRSSDPWDESKHVVEVHYSIVDMNVPTNVSRFKKMVTWLCNQLQEGKTVHVGCVGGHGRTGIVLSAIVAEAGKKDAIQYVRKHYCQKAVESKEQVRFLMKHYDVSEVEPTKTYSSKATKTDWTISNGTMAPYKGPSDWPTYAVPKVKQLMPEGVSARAKSFVPMASVRSLWKDKRKKH